MRNKEIDGPPQMSSGPMSGPYGSNDRPNPQCHAWGAASPQAGGIHRDGFVLDPNDPVAPYQQKTGAKIEIKAPGHEQFRRICGYHLAYVGPTPMLRCCYASLKNSMAEGRVSSARPSSQATALATNAAELNQVADSAHRVGKATINTPRAQLLLLSI